MPEKPTYKDLENRVKALSSALDRSIQNQRGLETKLKRVEYQLHKSKQTLAETQELARVGSWEWDLNTGRVKWSDEVYRIFGLDVEHFQPQIDSVMSRFHPDDRKKHEELIKHALGKREIYTFEARILDSEKIIREVLSTSRGQYDDKGNLTRIVGTVHDITERKQLESQLQQAQKLESIGNLAGGIAHDFNNILSSIIGFTELALDDLEKGTMLEENIQEVYIAGKRARDLVKQILAFARQSDEERKPIQVAAIASEVLKLIRSAIPTTIEVKETIQSQSMIMGNPSQLHQLFMNLCTNASQAMENTGGILEISVRNFEYTGRTPPFLDLKTGNYVRIDVSDTGPGIPPNIIGSVFEPYFTTKAVGEGTGMGLAMAHGIVESYEGKITVESKLGQGAVFSIFLPATKKLETYLPYGEKELPQGTENILFVDDEAPIANMGRQILARLGYSVTTRTSSIEALALFKNNPNKFDLVITDMTMPNMTGDKLAIEIMKIRPDIPVILCTGYSRKITDETAFEIGIKAFTYKPLVQNDLAKTVRNVLDADGSVREAPAKT
jgi:PAS domain S-box-containing protein